LLLRVNSFLLITNEFIRPPSSVTQIDNRQE